MPAIAARAAGRWRETTPVAMPRHDDWYRLRRVHIEDDVLRPSQACFPLAPGARSRIRLLHEGGHTSPPAAMPARKVRAPNQDHPACNAA